MKVLSNFSKSSLIVLGVLFLCSCQPKENTGQTKSLAIDDEITISEVHQAYQNGDYTIAELTEFYLDRIDAISNKGPQLNAVIMVNPDALEIAKALDEEYKAGKIRGPMHGIPVLLKDNIDTGDKMPCTAGARAMAGSMPLQDSPLAAQLRAAGAVILGKANLSEWANFHSNSSSSGWSGLGGQAKNPYDLTRNPCGSSAGSGIAVAANLCVVAIGTETNGSVVCPSNNNGIVGIKPTVGLISRSGIIPISFTQDTAGPMARTLRDAAICLGTLTAVDSSDSKTLNPERVAHSDYTQFLNEASLEGKRIGVYKSPIGDNVRVGKVMDEAIAFFESKGAVIVEIENILPSGTGGNSYQMMLYEFKDGLNKYFASLGPDAKIKSLEDLIEMTFADSVEMHYHDHELLKTAQEKGAVDSDEFIAIQEAVIRKSREEGMDKVMNENELDVIIAPTGGPAWKTDLVNGDNFGIFSSSPAAISGYPAITVPMGNIDGLPLGLSIFGRPWTEGALIEMAYTFEQGTNHRITPQYLSGI